MGGVFEFAGRTPLHHAVGMIVGHELAIGGTDRLEFGVVRHAEDQVGIVTLRSEMAGTDAPERALAEPESQADIFQELHLGIGDDTVGTGDLEEAVQHAFQKAGPVAVLAADTLA